MLENDYLVELDAKVVHTGTSSMHIFIQVRSGTTQDTQLAETNHCIITFVALDAQGKPTSVPTFVATTDEDKFLEQYAIQMKDFSQSVEQQMLDFYQQKGV